MSRAVWYAVADWIYPPSHDRTIGLAVGTLAAGALLLMAAAHRISHHA